MIVLIEWVILNPIFFQMYIAQFVYNGYCTVVSSDMRKLIRGTVFQPHQFECHLQWRLKKYCYLNIKDKH